MIKEPDLSEYTTCPLCKGSEGFSMSLRKQSILYYADIKCVRCGEFSMEAGSLKYSYMPDDWLDPKEPCCPKCYKDPRDEVNEINSLLGQMGGQTIWYNLSTNESKDLETVEELKYGTKVRCKGCQEVWFLGEKKDLMSMIDGDGDKEIVDQWNSRDLKPSRDQLFMLDEIEPTPYGFYFTHFESIEVPCKCRLKSGDVLDHCLVKLQRHPPLGLQFREQKGYIFLDGVDEIEISEYALPLWIRKETADAPERQMGFSPSGFETKDGRLISFNGPVNFLAPGDIKGSDLRPASGESSGRYLGDPWDIITLVFGDLTDEAREMLQRESGQTKPIGPES